MKINNRIYFCIRQHQKMRRQDNETEKSTGFFKMEKINFMY